MRCPKLFDLPDPPYGKKGWPWTVETPQLPSTMSDGKPWPRLSIVTPSYNQGQFIEETIRSVLLQGYPELEYIVMDGGSTDQTVDVIRKYEPWIECWASESDGGQSHAINKGLMMASGQIMSWLNSDDFYYAHALGFVAEGFAKNTGSKWLAGDCQHTDEGGYPKWLAKVKKRPGVDYLKYWDGVFFSQPSVFFTKDLLNASGLIDQDLYYAMDIELWFRFLVIEEPILLSKVLSANRCYDATKTSRAHKNAVDEFTGIILNAHLNNGKYSEKYIRKRMNNLLVNNNLVKVVNSVGILMDSNKGLEVSMWHKIKLLTFLTKMVLIK